MKFRSIVTLAGGALAASAFVVVMERPAQVTIQDLFERFDSRVVEEQLELDCLCCADHRKARLLSWKIMGEAGSRTLATSDTPSVFSTDFPEFTCRHYWVPEGDGSPEIMCGSAWGFALKYSEDELLRERVQDGLFFGNIDREDVFERVEGERLDATSTAQAILDEIEYGKPPPVPGPLPIAPADLLMTRVPWR
jgi:hypothetical protein